MAIAPPKRKSAIQVFFMVVLLGLLTNPAEVDARKIPFVSLKPIVLNMAEDELSTKVGNGCEKATITQGTVNGAYGVDNTMDYVDVPDNHPNKVRFYRAIANGTESGYYFCEPGALTKFLTEEGKVKEEYQPAGDIAQFVIMAINYILLAVAKLGGMLLWLASLIMMPLLTWSHFITDPLVQSGWPFLQGIANLGFIFALLFIAISTTLRLDIGNPKKMLPRLLIAALLINFSLVIAGVILDISRVVMSIIFRAITGEATEKLPYEMLTKSDLVNVAFNTGTLKADGTVSLATSSVKWGSVADVAMGTLFIWLGAIAFLVITIGLLVRYIALILLLIVSPVAYLALAFPGMQGVAKKWWSEFLKYVLYGPIMIFVLALLVTISNLNIASDNFSGDGYSFVRAAFKVALMLGFSIAAAVAGSKLGAIGANATVNFAKRMPGMAYRNPKATAAILGGVATGGAGWLAAGAGAAGGALAAKGTGMAGRRAWKGVTRPYKTFMKSWENDKKDAEEERQKKSYGATAYKKLFGETSKQKEDADNDAVQVRSKGTLPGATPATAATITPEALKNERLASRLNKDEINGLTENVVASGNAANIITLLGNVELMGQLKPETRAKVYNTNNVNYIRQLHTSEDKYKKRYELKE